MFPLPYQATLAHWWHPSHHWWISFVSPLVLEGQQITEQIVTCFCGAFLYKQNYVYYLLGFFPPALWHLATP